MKKMQKICIQKAAGLLFLMISLVSMLTGCSVNFEDGSLEINGSMEFSTEFSTEFTIGTDVETSEAESQTNVESSESATDTIDAEIQSSETGTEEVPGISENSESKNTEPEVTEAEIGFRNQSLLDQHYEKHGIEMGFASAEEYELAAYKVIINSDSLHKIEAEDGDDVYYLESTNEFVVVSKDGYIRTYFYPSAGIDYFNRQ